jgi:hypothetical protein
MQSLQEDGARLGETVRTDAAQQRDAIGTGCRGTDSLHDALLDPVPDTALFADEGGRVAFSDQHIAVWQHVQPARMIESGRQCAHGESGRRPRLGTGGPADRTGEFEGRDECRMRSRQNGLRTRAIAHRQRGPITAASYGQCEQTDPHQARAPRI